MESSNAVRVVYNVKPTDPINVHAIATAVGRFILSTLSHLEISDRMISARKSRFRKKFESIYSDEFQLAWNFVSLTLKLERKQFSFLKKSLFSVGVRGFPLRSMLNG